MAAQTKTDDHQAIRDKFADYADGALDDAGETEMEQHLSSCAECEAAFERFQRDDVGLSGLHKMSAPPAFQSDVRETIRRRSDGRFFGRRAFGDRIPFELLAVLAILTALAAFALVYLGASGGTR